MGISHFYILYTKTEEYKSITLWGEISFLFVTPSLKITLADSNSFKFTLGFTSKDY